MDIISLTTTSPNHELGVLLLGGNFKSYNRISATLFQVELLNFFMLTNIQLFWPASKYEKVPKVLSLIREEKQYIYSTRSGKKVKP